MGGRTWGVVAVVVAAGCAGGAGDDGRDDGPGPPEQTTSVGPGSSGAAESGTGGSSSGELFVPTSTGEAGSTSSSSSSASGVGTSEGETGAPVCGDGQVDVDEACDDGNAVDGDGCNLDCQPSGRLLWSDRYGGGLGMVDEAYDCAVDSFGAIYAAGFTTLSKTDEDVWTRSWAADGAVLWTQTYGGPLLAKDRGQAIVVDATQLVYAAGHVNVDMQGNDVWVRKHAADGTPTWTHGYDSATSGNDAAYAATLTATGDLLVVGAHAAAGEGLDIWLRKLDEAGAVLWTRTYTGSSGLSEVGRAISVDADGYITVAGQEGVTDEGANMWVGRFDPDGNLLWSRLYAGEAGMDDVLYGAAATSDGGAVVCGVEESLSVPTRGFVRRYDADGLAVWTVLDDGPDDAGASCFEVAIAGDGAVLLAGSAVGAAGTRPRFQRWDADGVELWSTTITGAGGGSSHGRCVREAPDGTIVVAGALDDGVDGRDVWVGRLSP